MKVKKVIDDNLKRRPRTALQPLQYFHLVLCSTVFAEPLDCSKEFQSPLWTRIHRSLGSDLPTDELGAGKFYVKIRIQLLKDRQIA